LHTFYFQSYIYICTGFLVGPRFIPICIYIYIYLYSGEGFSSRRPSYQNLRSLKFHRRTSPHRTARVRVLCQLRLACMFFIINKIIIIIINIIITIIFIMLIDVIMPLLPSVSLLLF